MKKSTIWLLACVMVFAFAGLLYVQINYVSIMLKTRSEQFNETVKQSLHQVAKNLELDETRQYLEADINNDITRFLNQQNQLPMKHLFSIEDYQMMEMIQLDGSIQQILMHSSTKVDPLSGLTKQEAGSSIVKASKEQLKILLERYLHQGGLLEEVIYNMLYTANLKPIEERINFKKLDEYLSTEFANNALNLPYVFSVINKDGNIVYQSGEIKKQPMASDVITQVLFSNDPPSKLNYLKVYFPTKGDYISSSITFIVPSVIFSIILLITFIFTLFIVFRQKKLSEMKNDFINNMTHELKTPITITYSAIDALQTFRLADNPVKREEYFNICKQQLKQLTELVEKILSMAIDERKNFHLQKEQFQVAPIVKRLSEQFALKANKPVRFQIENEWGEQPVYADRFHLTHVIANLIDNAIKYSGEEVEISIRLKRNERNLEIDIKDNGCGIPAKYQKQIFERFYRISKGNRHDVKGYGLGLSYAKEIIERHGGSIQVSSQENKGSIFTLLIPQ